MKSLMCLFEQCVHISGEEPHNIVLHLAGGYARNFLKQLCQFFNLYYIMPYWQSKYVQFARH